MGTFGGPQPGSGRPRGVVAAPDSVAPHAKFVDSTIRLTETAVQALAKPDMVPPPGGEVVRISGETPLEFLLRIMRNKHRIKGLTWRDRLYAARTAAEYMHAKQPQAIHVTAAVKVESVSMVVQAGPWRHAAGFPVPILGCTGNFEETPPPTPSS